MSALISDRSAIATMTSTPHFMTLPRGRMTRRAKATAELAPRQLATPAIRRRLMIGAHKGLGVAVVAAHHAVAA